MSRKPNGHRELICQCGEGQVSKRIRLRSGRAAVASEGQCDNCGSISITSGDWRTAQNPDRFAGCSPTDRDEDRDWSFGNPLTYNDRVAEIYGSARFGHGEGFHGTLTSRYGLLKGKRWFRTQAAAETDVALVF